MTLLRFACIASMVALASGCASTPQYDYAAFKASKPKSIVIMPPVNQSPDVTATAAVWAQTVKPLAEAGYYVLPITLVDEQLKQNGVTTPEDARQIPLEKLHGVFGADAALYIDVERYGTSFRIFRSVTEVHVAGSLVDLRTGAQLWKGYGVATTAGQEQNMPGGVLGMVAVAVVKQVVNSVSDAGFKYAGLAQDNLLAVPKFHGVLPGPRSPYYGQPMPTSR